MVDTTTDATSVASTPKPRRRTKLERETTITFNELEGRATLWTTSLREVHRWAALDLVISPQNGGWTATVDKKRVKISRPRSISPQNSVAARERLAMARMIKADKRAAQNSTDFSGVSQPPSEPCQ